MPIMKLKTEVNKCRRVTVPFDFFATFWYNLAIPVISFYTL